MPNFQLADFGMFDPNSEWAKQAAAQVMQQQAAQQTPPAEMVQAPQAAPAVAVQQPAPQATPMPNNNGLAAKAAGVLTPLDDAGRALAAQIAKFKMNYDAAQAAGDTAGMEAAHAGAENLRKAAGQYGVDLSRLGANDSTAAYQAMLQADYAKGVADVANMLTPQEYYQQQIQQNMANGMSRRRAEESALGALEAYEGQYRRTLGNAFIRYGVNDQGEMNRFGAQIANLLYGQNPQSVALYDQYYANPMQQWKFDKNMEVQDKLYGQKVDFGQHQFEWNRQLNNDKFDAQKWLAQYNGNHQMAMQRMAYEFQRANAQEQMDLFHKDPELFYALRGFGPNGQKNGKQKEPSDKELTSAQNIRDIYNAELASLKTVGETIEKLQAIKEKTADYDTRELIDDMCYSLNAHREAASWNDAGQKNRPTDNFRNYYEAVKRHPELVEDIRYIYDDAVYKKDHPDQSPPRSKEWYDARNHTYGINRMN